MLSEVYRRLRMAPVVRMAITSSSTLVKRIFCPMVPSNFFMAELLLFKDLFYHKIQMELCQGRFFRVKFLKFRCVGLCTEKACVPFWIVVQ